MREMEHMQKVMDAFFDSLENPKEKQAREDERKKENEHRKEEGLNPL